MGGSAVWRLGLGADKNSLAGLGGEEVDEAVDGLLRRTQRVLPVALHRLGRGAGGRRRVAALVGLARLVQPVDHQLDEVAYRVPGAVRLIDDEEHRAAVADIDQARKLKPSRLEQVRLPRGQGELANGGVLLDQAGEVPVADESLDVFLGRGVEPFDLGRGETGGETSGEPALAGAGHLDGRAGEHTRHVGLRIGLYDPRQPENGTPILRARCRAPAAKPRLSERQLRPSGAFRPATASPAL